MAINVIYRTSDEIHYVRGLFARNRPAFLLYAELILANGRSYEGAGMSVNVKLLKNILRDLTRLHLRQTQKTEKEDSRL